MQGSEQPRRASNDDYEDIHSAAEQASRCRRLAQHMHDRNTSDMLKRMAEDYDRRAGRAGPAEG